MTRYEAHIDKSWKEHGFAQVLVARIRDGGDTDFGVFLVDTWCLGVKDAFGESGVPVAVWRELVEERLPEAGREMIHPACARKLIEGAIAYAETLGFAPHRDYRKARRVLGGIEAAMCPTAFAYGRAGRPCFVPGPDDSEERIDRVLAILEARVGPEGFDYEELEGGEDDVAELRDALMNWLAAEPDDVPRFYFLSGLVTALQLCPGTVPPTKVFEVLWPEGRKWESQEELSEFTGLFMRYWNYIADRVADALEGEPFDAEDEEEFGDLVDIWQADLPEQEEGKDYDALPFLAAVIEWSQGFWRATEEWPEAWGDAFGRADLAPHWEIVRRWAGYLKEENRLVIDAASEEPVPRNLGRSLRALVLALRRRPAHGGE